MRRTACRLGCSQTEWISHGGVDLRRQSRDSRDSEHTLMGLFLGWAAVVLIGRVATPSLPSSELLSRQSLMSLPNGL
jgi:hypothetical protein